MNLEVKGTTVVSLTKYPGDPETTQVLVLSYLLTPPLAEKFRCREACYTDNGVPRRFEGNYGLMIRVEDVDIRLGAWSGHANLLHKFKISRPKGQADNDISLHGQVRIHFDGTALLSDWVDQVNKGEFVMSINARQGEFDFSAEEEGMKGAPAETEVEQPQEPEPAGPGLASARETVGGTPGRRRRRGSGKDAAANDTGDADEFAGNCVACENNIPFAQGSTKVHESGATCTRPQTAPSTAVQ